MKTSILSLISLGLICVPFSLLNAAVVTWDGGGDGTSWGTTLGGANNNWSGDTVPNANDDVTINPAVTTAVNYNTALYIDAATDLRTFYLGNSTVGQTTTLNVSANFDLQTNIVGTEWTVGPRGTWNQTAGTTRIFFDSLIDGGTVQTSLGSLINMSAAGGGGVVVVRNGGAINIGGAFQNGNGANITIGETGSGSFTMGTGATNPSTQMRLQVGNGTTGTGTVNWNATADTAANGTLLNVVNGVFNHNVGAGRVGFSSHLAGDLIPGVVRIGTGTGTGVLNKDSSALFIVDATAGAGNVVVVGANGTVNWSAGDLFSNGSDDEVLNQGEWNYTRASGTSAYRYGPVFKNEGTFNWEGAAGLNLNPGAVNGAGDFVNDGTLATRNDGRVTLQADLVLNSIGILDVGLGADTTTGLLSTGNGIIKITLGGHLAYTELTGFQYDTNYTILSAAAGTISGAFATFDPNIVVIDDGLTSGNYIIQIIPEPGTASLFLAAGAAFFCLRQRKSRRS